MASRTRSLGILRRNTGIIKVKDNLILKSFELPNTVVLELDCCPRLVKTDEVGSWTVVWRFHCFTGGTLAPYCRGVRVIVNHSILVYRFAYNFAIFFTTFFVIFISNKYRLNLLHSSLNE